MVGMDADQIDSTDSCVSNDQVDFSSCSVLSLALDIDSRSSFSSSPMAGCAYSFKVRLRTIKAQMLLMTDWKGQFKE